MNIKSLFIIPMMAPVLINSAQASLPDEINYQPYKIQYDQLAAEVDVVTASLNQSTEQLQYAYNQEAQTINNIQNLEDENIRIQNQIRAHEDERVNLSQRGEDLGDEIDTLNKRINTLESQRNQVEREMIREERRLAPMQDRIARIETQLSRKNIEVENARRSFRQVEGVSATLRSQLQQLQNERKSLKSAVANLESQLATIDGKISSEESKLAAISSKIPSATQTLESQQSKKKTLASELSALQKELADVMRADRADPRVRELRGQVAAKAKEVQAQDRIVAQAKSQLDTLKTKKSNLTTSVGKLKSQKKSIPAKIQKTKTSLQTKIELISTKKVEVANAEKKTAQRRGEVDRLAIEANDMQNNLSHARQDLVRESSRHARLRVDLQDLNGRVNEVSNILNSTTNQYNSTMEQLDTIERQIPELQRNQRNNTAELKRLDDSLANTQDQIASLNSDITRLSSEQTQSITARDRKYEEYISRHDYYGQKLSEAKTLGASQTDVAINIAKTDSNTYVDSRSIELGNQVGQELASAQSNLWASVRAEITGYADGYAEGHASDADEARGKDEGTKAGVRSAIDYANRVLKPQYFNQYYAERIQSAQLKINEVQNINETTFDMIDSQVLNVSSLLSGVTPISSAELSQSMEIATGLDQSVSTFKTNLSQVIKQKANLSQARTAYQEPSNIPYQGYDCSSIYKNVQAFKTACKASYHATFESKYTNEYYANFAAQYTELYEDVVEEKRAAIITSIYDADLAKFYPIAKDSGISDGKADIYKETYARAKANAYNSELPSARANAESTAQTEVTTHINTNATLTLKGATITNSDLQGGSRAKVTVKVKNISPTALSKPVKIVITNVENATIPTREFYIKTAGGNRTTDFTDIAFQINPNARSNQRITIQGKVVLSGGKYNAERVETFTATATTALNPSVNANYEYDSSPQVLTTFRRRTLIHNFDASVSPKIETVRSGYNVQIAAAPGYEGMIKFSNTSVPTGSLNYGSSKNVRFQYTFPKSSKGKTVKIHVNYVHQGKKVKTEVLELRPH
jgi:predicted  nucleic acid-binding Zn-ribbon protein